MKKLLKTALLAALLTAGAYAKVSDVLLAAPKVPLQTLSDQTLESIFLGTSTHWSDGTRITVGYVLDRPERMEAFLQERLGQSLKRYQKYWVRRVFSGYGTAPRIFKDAGEALEFVKSTPGAIIFVPVQETQALSGQNYTALN